MRFFHISDLHLGIKLYEFDLLEDQRFILDQIISKAVAERPEGIFICGDIYDRSVPPEAAVRLFDDFVSGLSDAGLKVFIISGNHDSSDRLAFGSRLMEDKGVYISRSYNGHVSPVVLNDAYGPLNIYLLPFIRPAAVRRFFEDETISDYTDAMRTVINEMQADPNARNILLSHQFITGAARSESEDIIVGGLDNVDASVFRDFDYTALGHIHNAQNISADNPVRYCGTPLKYSISEASQNKSVTVVDIKEKGNVSLEFIPLVPMRDLREIRGNYDDLMSRWNYEGTNTKDYIHVTLTDETDVIDAVSRMRSVYPNIIKLDYDNTRTRTVSHIEPVSVSESMSHLDLFRGFFKLQNGKDITDEQEKLLVDLIEKIREEDNQ
ncbi:MAG: exonuclease SbcCD subunit D [Oscillospiraceae bacterium]|nr:exonuclease SbcCD subunit D [Oscillospiraceae bacterium]